MVIRIDSIRQIIKILDWRESQFYPNDYLYKKITTRNLARITLNKQLLLWLRVNFRNNKLIASHRDI